MGFPVLFDVAIHGAICFDTICLLHLNAFQSWRAQENEENGERGVLWGVVSSLIAELPFAGAWSITGRRDLLPSFDDLIGLAFAISTNSDLVFLTQLVLQRNLVDISYALINETDYYLLYDFEDL